MVAMIVLGEIDGVDCGRASFREGCPSERPNSRCLVSWKRDLIDFMPEWGHFFYP